jgi:hypothetical protein
MLRVFERGVLMRIRANKKDYKANTCKQERVLKGILVRKAERKGECVQARKSVKETTCKEERVLRVILESNEEF